MAKIFEFSDPDAPFPYYVMEFVEGESLRTWIEGRVGTRRSAQGSEQVSDYLRVVEIAFQIASGLKAAHDLGVYHLDLKPEKVLLTPESDGRYRVKLVDFNFLTLQRGGLAYYSLLPLQATITYCAPEVKQNIGNATIQSDIYTLGLLIVEMVAGYIDPRSIFDELTRLTYEEPRLGVLVLSCIEADPAKRPQDCDRVIRTLGEIREELELRKAEIQRVAEWKWLAPLKTLSGGSLLDVIVGGLDIIRGKPLRTAELALGLAVPVFLLGALFRILWGALAGSRIDTTFIPVFIAATSFTLLQAFYFFQLVFRCEFWRSRFPSLMRSLMAWSYIAPVLIGALMPAVWPWAAAFGLLLVGITNSSMWRYAADYRSYSPELLPTLRNGVVVTLAGYALWAFIYTVTLAGGGVLVHLAPESVNGRPFRWWADLVLAVVIFLLNALLYYTKISGESSKRIWTGLRVEYSIRAKIAEQRFGVANGEYRT